jgi:hypothetical protein
VSEARVRNAARRAGRPAFAGLALACSLGAHALAQDGAVPTASPDPQGLSPPVVAGGTRDVRIDARRLALARQVYDIAGAPAFRATARSLTSTLGVQLGTAMAARDSAHAHAMVEAVGDGLNTISPQLADEAVSRIAREFTLDQLQELAAFYQTPTGELAARRMPAILQQTVGSVLSYIPQMMAGIEDSYCSRVKCSRSERKAFDDVAARMAAAHPAAAG